MKSIFNKSLAKYFIRGLANNSNGSENVARDDLINSSLLQFRNRNWDSIKDSCKGRSGVYAFINNVNGSFYIGSAVCLYSRLRDYHQPWYVVTNSSFPIVRAIKKHGMDNFTILILEFTSTEGAVPAEQVWIDTYKPRYNVLALAGSSLGYKHDDAGKAKISLAHTGKLRSADVREAMRLRQAGSGNTFFGSKHTEESKALIRAAALARVTDNNPGFKVTVLDTTTGITTSYKSLRSAAKALNGSHSNLAKFNGKLYQNRYLITVSGKV